MGGLILHSYKLYKFQNYPGNLYGFILLIVTSIIYHHATQLKYLRTISTITAIVFVATFINLFFFQKHSFSTYNDLLVSFVIICCAVFYLYRLMVELPTSQIHTLPMFWFNFGFLFYHAGAFFLFAFASYLFNVLKNDMWIYWIFHNTLDIVQHFIIFVGLYYDLSRRAQLIAPALKL